MIAADLPYGTTQNKWDVIIPFDELWGCYRQILNPNGVITLTARQPFTSQLVMSNPDWFKLSMVWRKNLKTGNLNARKRPMVGFEDVVVFYDKQPTYNPQRILRTFQQKSGNKKNSKTENYGKQREDYIDRQSDWLMPDDVLDYEDGFFHIDTLDELENGGAPMLYYECVHNSQGKVHPTQKPVALFEWLIRSFTNEGGTVLDNCMGSGTTGIASKNANRSFIGIELDVKYFRTALDRICKAFSPNLFEYESCLKMNKISESEYNVCRE